MNRYNVNYGSRTWISTFPEYEVVEANSKEEAIATVKELHGVEDTIIFHIEQLND